MYSISTHTHTHTHTHTGDIRHVSHVGHVLDAGKAAHSLNAVHFQVAFHLCFLRTALSTFTSSHTPTATETNETAAAAAKQTLHSHHETQNETHGQRTHQNTPSDHQHHSRTVNSQKQTFLNKLTILCQSILLIRIHIHIKSTEPWFPFLFSFSAFVEDNPAVGVDVGCFD